MSKQPEIIMMMVGEQIRVYLLRLKKAQEYEIVTRAMREREEIKIEFLANRSLCLSTKFSGWFRIYVREYAKTHQIEIQDKIV